MPNENAWEITELIPDIIRVETDADPRHPYFQALLHDTKGGLGYHDSTSNTCRYTYINERDDDGIVRLHVLITRYSPADDAISSHLTDGIIYSPGGDPNRINRIWISLQSDRSHRLYPNGKGVLFIPYHPHGYDTEFSENLNATHAAAMDLLTDENRISPFIVLTPAQP